MKMKYECPPASKFGNDSPLWKTATSMFLRVVKETVPQLRRRNSSECHSDFLRMDFFYFKQRYLTTGLKASGGKSSKDLEVVSSLIGRPEVALR